MDGRRLMWALNETFKTPAPITEVWTLYTEPRWWPKWTPDITHGRWTVGSECRVGSCGEVKFKGLPLGSFEITAADPPHSFTTETRFPIFLLIRFEHRLMTTGHGTRIEERISFHGLLAPLVGLLERHRIRTSWPLAMATMAELAMRRAREGEAAAAAPAG